MVSLQKSHFIATIEAIRMQLHKDLSYADAVSLIFNTDSIGPYDNSLLVKQLISHLQIFFPRDKDGFCEIEHYCFDMNFGKIGDQELVTVEDLWYRLLSKDMEVPSVFDFIKYANKEDKKNNVGSFKVVLNKIEREPIISTHPLIDDYQNLEVVFEVIEKPRK
ncbi:MAG: hypothetical protein ACRC6H_00685 [Culicoidibacterales bacterium]